MTSNVLAELGNASEPAQEDVRESDAGGTVTQFPSGDKQDYFVERDGVEFAGRHLLVEMWGAKHLDDPEMVEAALCEAATAAGATILHSHTHRFSPYGGVSGVVVLAESHITIHTWPEREYAAIDIFMCGGCHPYESVSVLRRMFEPSSLQLAEHKRGLIP